MEKIRAHSSFPSRSWKIPQDTSVSHTFHCLRGHNYDILRLHSGQWTTLVAVLFLSLHKQLSVCLYILVLLPVGNGGACLGGDCWKLFVNWGKAFEVDDPKRQNVRCQEGKGLEGTGVQDGEYLQFFTGCSRGHVGGNTEPAAVPPVAAIVKAGEVDQKHYN